MSKHRVNKTKKYCPEHRYHNYKSDSTIKQEQQAEHDGRQLNYRKKTWTQEEDDRLLDGYLVHEWRYRSQRARDCFANQLGRTLDGIETRLRKLAYNHSEASGYTPIDRVDRTGREFTVRDRYLIGKACGEVGRKYGGDNIRHMGYVLARSEDEVRRYLADLTRPKGGLCDKIGHVVNLSDETITRTVGAMLDGYKTEI